ncbi:MAG: phosphomannomutase/phosphoglucomutase [Patescibacteria group bacterium]|nr:phosphomannomutase/phosphoglucomutase [Patescibacteria group bacterium]
MTIDSKIFKAYDIRGIYPTDINEENFAQIVKATYTFLYQSANKNEPLSFVVGRDMRISSPALAEIAIKTLVDLGATVIDIGVVSTPTFYFAVYHYGYDAGFQITASHNPKEWTGLKIVKKGPKGLIKIGKPTGIEDIKKMALEGQSMASQNKGSVTKITNALKDEVENALKLFDYPKIDHFKIVADPANSMGGEYINALFERIPAEIIRMNFELDGSFPVHQPDPLQFDTLKDLQKRVREEKADFGLAPDGDGDRLFFIDEKGKVIPGNMITALVARELLKKYPGEQILFDIRNILTPQKIVEELGGKPGITKVGHALITDMLNETGAIFAGEGSGHYFYRATGNAESQVITILNVLLVMTEEKKSLSEIINELRRSYESTEINFKVNNTQEILEKLKEKYKDGQLSTSDGISISYPDWRFNVRTSNTEPLLRLNEEALNQELMVQKRDELVSLINSLKK